MRRRGPKTTLRFATWDSDESLAIQQAIAKKFEEKHPGVKVQVEPYADGYDQKLVAAFGAGSPPDVMYMWNFPQYYTSLMPLDDLIAKDAAEINPSDIPEGLMNTTRVERQDLWHALGLHYPGGVLQQGHVQGCRRRGA